MKLIVEGPVEFSQSDAGLEIKLPSQRPNNLAAVFKMSGVFPRP